MVEVVGIFAFQSVAGFIRWFPALFQGHWSFVTRLPSMPDESGKRITANDERYKLYAEETANGVTGSAR